MLTTEQLDEASVVVKGGVIDKIGQNARIKMHKKFMQIVRPQLSDTLLDVGASASPAFLASNYLEFACPQFNITAVGLGEENPVWKKLYPNIRYIHGGALELRGYAKSR